MSPKRLFLLLLLMLAGAGSVKAKGPAEQITISGPGLASPIEVTEPAALESLSMAILEDFRAAVEPPAGLDQGYLLARSYANGERGGFVPFDEVVYYPDPAGGRGYVHYLHIVNGWGPYDGKWYRATAAGDATMRALLNHHGVDLSAPGSAASLDKVVARSGRLALLGAIILGGPLLAGVLLIADRRRMKPAA